MLDTNLFGLALICDGEYLFAEPDSKLSKYAPKSWRSSHTHGLDANGRPALAFYFRVQFFVDSPLLLRDETTRHHYYLQLRHNAASRAVAEQALVLAGLALQADLGDRVEVAQAGYFRPEDYVPPALRGPWAIQAIENSHRDNRGLNRAEAELQYIREACQMTEPINAHVFRLRASKQETLPGSITLAVCAHGIKVCPDNNPASTFLWSSIGKLSFERKKFEIRTGHEKLTLFTSGDEKSKLLLALCKDTHQFSMAVAPRLNEARKQEEEQRRCLRDCYLYSRMPCKAGRLDQRVSVISSTSSNTTSGIVSDRVHSEDELEIMITCPPAPSTESLALAHLLDSNPISRQSSSASAPNYDKSLTSLANTIENMSVLAINQEKDYDSSESGSSCSDRLGSKETGKQVDSESSVSQKTAGKCAGSQCSSSCSTVVVAETKISRRASTSSSLELGYSHTAQNSTVSDATCIELDTRENTSGVYTLGNANTVSSQTSGVYTMGSSQMTGSSEAAGNTSHITCFEHLDQFTSIDQVDSLEAFRDRSNSNVSNSGSFRGDGSDPTDNKQALLSAEELSDLIVGRGVYPSRKTVSHTLDSDSDYVTLPLSYQGGGFTPIPPKRVDSNNIHNNSLLGIVDSTSSIDSESCFRPPPPYPSKIDHLSKVIGMESVTDFDEASCMSEDIPPPLRDPPPYPANLQNNFIPMYPSEEAAARFITTRPQINILTAHTSVVGASSAPSYAAPALSTAGSISSGHSSGVPPIPPKQPVCRPPPSYPNPENGLKSLANVPVAGIIAPNNYLDVAASKASVLLPYTFLPPPPPAPRQPPPPPPALATVYTSQLSRSQIEQYQQQMYSDVDFVVFPLKEPAISKQEYLEAKQGSLLAALAQGPPPYPNKAQMFYRSTPYLPVSIPTGRYSSNQNLSDTYVQLPVYSAASLSSTSSLEPPPPPPPHRLQTLNRFMRARSDDNILKSFDTPAQPPKFRRLPPPPPPSTDSLEKGPRPILLEPKDIPPPQSSQRSKTSSGGGVIDIRTLREKSKNLDLPLISALCNDRSLIKQTKAFVMPKHPSGETPLRVSGSSKSKYPVSGLSNTQINKPLRKPPSSHRHPGDKLPEIPRAPPNNYVMTDPRGKHKTMQSHS